jgi:hypothetical protein
MRTKKLRAKITFLNILDDVFGLLVSFFFTLLIICLLVLSILKTLLFFDFVDSANNFWNMYTNNKYYFTAIFALTILLIVNFQIIERFTILDRLSTDFFFKRKYFVLNQELKEIIAIKEAKENLEVTRRAKELHDILSEEQRIKESMKPTQRQKPPQEIEGNATKPEAFTGTFNDFENDILSPEDDDPKRPRGHRQDEPEEPHYDSEAERLKDIIRKRTE